MYTYHTWIKKISDEILLKLSNVFYYFVILIIIFQEANVISSCLKLYLIEMTILELAPL